MAQDNKNKILNVPPLRFPEFIEDWELQSLSEYLTFKNGLNPDAKRFGRGVKFISVMDILKNDFITYDAIISLVEPQKDDFEGFGVEYGDVLFQRSSETFEDIGRANVYLDDRKALFGGFVIRGKQIKRYNPRFIKYLLSAPCSRKKIIVKGAGAQHFNIGQEGLSKVVLNFPSLDEQEKIGKFLSLIDERIATQNKIIEELKKLKSAIYTTLFAPIKAANKSLGEIADIVKGKQINGEALSEQGKFYVMNGGIEPSGYLDIFNVQSNTISISEGGNSCGYVQWNDSAFWSGGHCYTLQNIENSVSNRYLYHYLKWKEHEIMALRIGSGLPNIQKKDLAKVEVPIPPLNHQHQIEKTVDAIENKGSTETELLKHLSSLKQYLLTKMFI